MLDTLERTRRTSRTACVCWPRSSGSSATWSATAAGSTPTSATSTRRCDQNCDPGSSLDPGSLLGAARPGAAGTDPAERRSPSSDCPAVPGADALPGVLAGLSPAQLTQLAGLLGGRGLTPAAAADPLPERSARRERADLRARARRRRWAAPRTRVRRPATAAGPPAAKAEATDVEPSSRRSSRARPARWRWPWCSRSLATAGLWYALQRGSQRTVTAYFANTVGLYTQNEVTIQGIPVGSVDEIVPQGDVVRVTLKVDNDAPVMANPQAVIVAPTLVSDRYVQLGPTYEGGPQLADGAIIPVEKTAHSRRARPRLPEPRHHRPGPRAERRQPGPERSTSSCVLGRTRSAATVSCSRARSPSSAAPSAPWPTTATTCSRRSTTSASSRTCWPATTARSAT